MQQHSISTQYQSDMAFESTIGDHFITIDSPEDGPGKGPSPKKLMLVSLAGCTGIDVVSILQKMKVSFSDFSIDVKATLTDEHPKIYNEVEVHYRIKVDAVDEDKVKRAVQLSEEKYCGVMAMFRGFSTVKKEIHFI